MKLTCLVVDDEYLARQLLLDYLGKISGVECIGVAASAIEAKKMIAEFHPDILFLDIEMPDLTGIELLKILKYKPLTIITTAYPSYAIESYELDVVDYLLKPFEFDRFYKAVTKALEIVGLRQGAYVVKVRPGEQPSQPFFFVKADNKIVKVEFDQILYIEGFREYIKIVTVAKPILTLMSMSRLLEQVPAHQFFRIHRSYIVNISKIESVQGHYVSIGGKNLKISKAQKEAFIKQIGA